MICEQVRSVEAVDPWSFVVLPDWHGAEGFAVADNPKETESYSPSLEIFRNIQATHGSDLIILPGDTQSGHWYDLGFRQYLQNELNMTDLTVNETISIAAENTYSATKQLFSESGFDKVLLALGDHELGKKIRKAIDDMRFEIDFSHIHCSYLCSQFIHGNYYSFIYLHSGGNPWRSGSDKLKGLPFYREKLTATFNRDNNGAFLFNDPIGKAPSRPFQTEFVNTSYAHVHKNVLFITVDAFHEVSSTEGRYFDRLHSSGGEGIVTCTVEGGHLNWFRNVLIEARKIDSIKHVFVQAHVPILHPVRKSDCSGQFFDRKSEDQLLCHVIQFKL